MHPNYTDFVCACVCVCVLVCVRVCVFMHACGRWWQRSVLYVCTCIRGLRMHVMQAHTWQAHTSYLHACHVCMWECVAVRMHHIYAACCSVLQCVAVCCSVLQCASMVSMPKAHPSHTCVYCESLSVSLCLWLSVCVCVCMCVYECACVSVQELQCWLPKEAHDRT